MSVATDPYTFTNGTVANALEVNARFNALYNIDTANITWTGTHTFNNNVTIGTDKKLYFRDTTNYIYSSAAGKLDQYCNGYRAGSKYNTGSGALYCYYDTSTTTGEIRQYFANSDASVYFEQDYTFTSGDVWWALQSNTKTPLIFSDTNNYFKMQTDVAIQATKKLFFDASTGTAALTGDTYTYEESANVLTTYVGGVKVQQLIATGIALQSGLKQFYDGGGDTYSQESSANVLDTYVGGTRIVRLDSGGMQLADIDPPAANYTVRKSGAKFYAEFFVNGSSSGGTNDDFNMGSSVSVSTYVITLDFDRNFSSGSYSSVASSSTAAVASATVTAKTANNVTITPYDYAGGAYGANWGGCITCHGTQA